MPEHMNHIPAFIDVAPLASLPPGRMLRVQRDGDAILLANVAGTIYATDDTCTHEDASLATGALDGDRVKCPLHGSRFCLRTGQALEEPAEQPLRCHPARIVDGRVEVALPPKVKD